MIVKIFSGIATKNFYIVHVHYFCYRNEKYYPAEIGVCRFNFQEGTKGVYHSIIHPGRLPLGSHFDAMQKSGDSHHLPVPSEDKDSNVNEVFSLFHEFLMVIILFLFVN